MRNLLIALSVISLVSCAHKGRSDKFNDHGANTLKAETLMLKNSDDTYSPLNRCYEKEMNLFLTDMRNLYLQDPKNWKYWSQMGNCLLWQKDYRQAVFYLKSAYNLAPEKKDKAIIMNNLALVYAQENQVEKAFDLYLESYKDLSESIVLNYNISLILVSHSSTKAATKFVDKLIKISKNDTEIKYLLGVYHLFRNELALASSYFNQLDDNFFTREDTSLILADWQFKLGNLDQAISILKDRSKSHDEELELKVESLHNRIYQQKTKQRVANVNN